MIKKCIFCGEEFSAKHAGTVYCSTLCRSRASKIKFIPHTDKCLFCGEEYFKKNRKQKFCCRECGKAYSNAYFEKEKKEEEVVVVFKPFTLKDPECVALLEFLKTVEPLDMSQIPYDLDR